MRKHFFLIALALCVQVWAATVTAPANLPQYYSTYINNKSASTLFTGIHNVAKVGYSSLSYDGLWTAYATTDVYPAGHSSAGLIWDMYGGCTFEYGPEKNGGNQCGTYSGECDCYNREHSIPKSWFGGSESANTPGTDIFHVVPTDGKVNGMRSNYAFGEVNSASYSHNGSQLGTAKSITISNTLLGEGNVTKSCTSSPVFEPIDEYKGDFARGYLGTMIRWAGGDYQTFTSGDGAQIFNTAYDEAHYYGLTQYGLALLLKWHRQDPVSQKEIDRNNGVQQKQGNRNPFIDYPILAEYIWGKYADQTFSVGNAVGSFESSFIPGVSDGDKNGSSIDPIPADYYTPVDGLQDSVLKSRLAELTWTHYTKRYSYGKGANKTWQAFWSTDRNATDNSVIDMYSNNKRYFNPSDTTASVTDCDIEHMFPNSWFGGEDGNKHAYCDLHHLVPADYSANRSKSNNGPGVPTDTTFNNAVWVNGKDANRDNLVVFCPPDQYKGDFARAFFYIATTYGDTAVWQTDNSVPHMTNSDWHEFLSDTRDLLLSWHRQDPVSEKELIRNNTVYSLQGNRNPFIDYPCLVEYIWGNMQGETFDLSCNAAPTAKYTITWNVKGSASSSQVTGGTKPTAPSVADCSADRVFVGWTTSPVVSSTKPELLYKSSEIPNATASTIYYAVFADKEGEGSDSDYTLYNGTLVEGDYIIYYGGKAMKASVSSAARLEYAELTPSNNTISSPAANVVWHIAQNGNYWTIYNTSVGKYAASTGTKNQSTLNADVEDEKILWTVSDKYDFTNKYNAANSINALLRNNGTYGFACYSSQTGDVLSLYKTTSTVTYSNYGLLCEDCTPEEPNASFASSTQSTTCGGAVVNALNKGGSAGSVTYTSSDTDVATVNANSGAVTIEKVGTTVITAYIGAAGCYTATSASYTLTVDAKEATMAFSDPTTSLEESESALNAATTNSDGTIVYASNNTAVATVNTSTGVVTAVKPGTARITASVAATDCYAASSAYYDLTVTAIPTYTITWKANGVTVQTDNVKRDALYSLPDDPSDCSVNRVFKGWTIEKNYENATTAPGDLFISAFAAPILTQDTTFYAVFADKQTTSLPITVTDSLTRAFTGVTGTSYTTWADKAGTSGVVYAGNSAGGNSAIQMRSDQSSAGIITTTSPGTIKNVTLVWNSNTNNTRVVNVYGKNTPYSSAADLYSTETQGTLLGSMKMSTDKTSLDISATYAYVGIRSNSGALYLDSVLFTWNVPGGATETTYINYSPRCNEEYDFRALAATEVTHNSFMANWTEAAGDSYTLDVTKDVKKQQETAVFDKDFTASLDGWTINNVSGYDNVWTHSTSYGAKATSYVNSTQNAAESWLLSSNIDLTNVVNPVLTLNHLFRYGTSVYLKIKEQSSESWDELSPTNWAAGSDWTFVNSVADLSSYAGKIIQIGFKYVGTSSACPTWEIKQITITGTTEVNDLESIDGYPRKVYDTSALVSGLDAKTTYYYTVTPENGIVSNRIEVTTLENEEPTNMENVFPAPDVRKLLINGQIFILREGFLCTLTGQRIR